MQEHKLSLTKFTPTTLQRGCWAFTHMAARRMRARPPDPRPTIRPPALSRPVPAQMPVPELWALCAARALDELGMPRLPGLQPLTSR